MSVAPTSLLSSGTASGIGGIGGAVGGLISGLATAKGYDQTAAGINQGIGTAGQYNTEAQSKLDPYAALGVPAANNMSNNVATAAGGIGTGVDALSRIANGSGPNISAFYDPSMAFTANQATQALQRSASARGGVISGGGMKDIAEYINGLATTNFNNAAGMALNEQGQQINAAGNLLSGGVTANGQLSTLVNAGANAASTGAQLQEQTGQFIGSGQAAAGAANGAATAAQGSAIGSAISGVVGGIASIFSDKNVKENVKDGDIDVNKALDKISAKSFTYNQEVQDKGAPKGKILGVMAQDMPKELTTKDEDGVLKLDGPKTISFMLAALASTNKRLNAAGV